MLTDLDVLLGQQVGVLLVLLELAAEVALNRLQLELETLRLDAKLVALSLEFGEFLLIGTRDEDFLLELGEFLENEEWIMVNISQVRKVGRLLGNLWLNIHIMQLGYKESHYIPCD